MAHRPSMFQAFQLLIPMLCLGTFLSAAIVAPGCRKQSATGPTPAAQGPSGALPTETTTRLGIEMVLISGGEFQMGSDDAVDTRPVHRVAIDNFYMDKHEVTQEIYERVMGANPSRRVGETNPVERVRWSDAVRFCNARSLLEGLQSCYDPQTRECRSGADGYRLPTEAEWEYACRAGSTGDYYFGVDASDLDSHGWHKRNARRRPHPVAEKRPNAFGLYDMAGNVWEWCNDWYQVDYYQGSPSDLPHGPATGEKKVLRGGAFSSSTDNCCSWTRYCDEPGFTDACIASDDYGFRCVRSAVAGATSE